MGHETESEPSDRFTIQLNMFVYYIHFFKLQLELLTYLYFTFTLLCPCITSNISCGINLTLFQYPTLFRLYLLMHLYAIYFKYAHDHRWYSPQRHSAQRSSVKRLLVHCRQLYARLHRSSKFCITRQLSMEALWNENIKYTTWAQQRKSILYWNAKTYFD